MNPSVKMVFCLKKLFRPSARKKAVFRDREKLLKFETEGQEFTNILRPLYSNNESSKQLLKQNNKNSNWKKNSWDLETYMKTL